MCSFHPTRNLDRQTKNPQATPEGCCCRLIANDPYTRLSPRKVRMMIGVIAIIGNDDIGEIPTVK
jgi:hypothetical protein